MADGSVVISTKLDTTGIEKGRGKIENSFKGLTSAATKLGTAVGLAFGIGAVVNFAKAGVKASNEIENAMIGLKSIVEGQGRSFAAAQSFIKQYTADGLIPATQAVTAYKNLAMRGYTDPQIKSTLQALKDSAAFGRQASLTLGTAVSSATEGLKNENSILVDNAGVTKNVSMMWKDYATSIGTTADKLTKQQKIQAEVSGIIEETRFQTGDAARVADTYSGSVMKLGFALNDLKIAVGNFIKPIARVVIPVLSTAIQQITAFFNMLAQISGALFGSQAKGAEQAQKQQQAIDGSVKGEKALAKSAGKTAKASEKQLANFDEIQKLSEAKSDTAGSGGTVGSVDIGDDLGTGADLTIGTVLDTSGFETSISGLKALFQPTIDSVKNLWGSLEPFKNFVATGAQDFYDLFLKPMSAWTLGEGLPRLFDGITAFVQNVDWESMNAGFRDLWEALSPFAINVGEGLLWLWENVLVPFGTWAMNEIVPKFLGLITAALEAFNTIWALAKPGLLWLWENFLEPIAAWTGGVIVTVIDNIVRCVTGLSDWCAANKDNIAATSGIVATFFAAWKAATLGEFIVNSGGVASAIGGLTTKLYANVAAFGTLTLAKIADKAETVALLALYAQDYIVNMAKGAAAIVSETAAWVASTAAKIANTAAQMAMTVATVAWNGICAIATTVTTAFGAAVTFLTSPIGLVTIAIGALIAVIVLLVQNWDKVKVAAQVVWGEIVKVWNGAAKWFTDKILTPIESGFKSSINFLISIAEGFVNGFINGINVIKKMLNTLSFDIPDWVPIIGGSTFGFNFAPTAPIKIPRLAQGGVIPPNREFMAILGDQKSGTNIEAPLETIVQAFKMAMNNEGKEININFTGSLAQVARLLKPEIDRESRRKGISLVTGGV